MTTAIDHAFLNRHPTSRPGARTFDLRYSHGTGRVHHRSQAEYPGHRLLPLQLGRNVDELIRISEALQTIDGNGVSVPANWERGDSVIVPAPVTVEDARKGTNGGGAGLAVETWYLAKKDLANQAK